MKIVDLRLKLVNFYKQQIPKPNPEGSNLDRRVVLLYTSWRSESNSQRVYSYISTTLRNVRMWALVNRLQHWTGQWLVDFGILIIKTYYIFFSTWNDLFFSWKEIIFLFKIIPPRKILNLKRHFIIVNKEQSLENK